jgi:phage-related holin
MIKILGIKFYWKIVLLGISFGPILNIIEKYFFNDWEFAIWISLLVGLDTFTGMWKAFRKKELSSKGYGQVITKIIIYGIFLIVCHALQNFTIGKTNSGWFGWIDNIAFGTLMVREAISIFENLAIISPTVFPTKWIDKLKQIQDDKIDNAGKNI